MPPTWPWLLVLAPIVGSFVGVVATRFAAPQTILWGRSRCPHCGHSLTARDLVPFASWLALCGRCRHCGAAISAAYPVIELAALAIAVWSLAVADGAMVWVTAGLGWTLLALAAIDWRHFVLPDFLTLPLIAAGLAAAWALDRSTVADRAIGAAAGFAFVMLVRTAYWQLRRREGIGLGDAKLLAAAGAWVAWQGLPSVVLIAAVAGLLAAVLARWWNLSWDDRVPFGAFLALGTWLVWLYGPPV